MGRTSQLIGLELFLTTLHFVPLWLRSNIFECRDILVDNGTRSIGKRLMKLEIVNVQDGTLPYRVRNTMRNINCGTLNSFGMLLFPFMHIFAASDIGKGPL